MDIDEALRKLIAETEEGELVFSTHAHVELQVRLALDDPDIHLDKAARVVSADPMLATKVVGLANSVAFNRTGRPISDVRSAVLKLGLNLVRGLSTTLIMKQFSMTSTGEHQALAVRLWEHTAHVAALCYVLARQVGGLSADMAMFAGIVHEVGGFYLVSRAASYPVLLDCALGELWRARGEPLLGEAVLRALAVPTDIAEAVRRQWQGNISLPPRSLADIVFLAHCLTPIANPLQAGNAETARADLLALAAQVMADDGLVAMLEESGEELNSLIASLSF